MKDPINIALIALVCILLGFTIYKNMGNGSDPVRSGVAEGPVDASGYVVTEIPGSPVKRMEKFDGNNILLESGEMLNDMKTGTWTTYHPDGRIKSISTYINGKLDGVFVNFTERGHVQLQTFYKDGLLHGSYTTYNSGTRKSEERFYNMGKLDGISRQYDNLGKIQKEIGFKNDIQHGIFKQYDPEGNVMLEYEYDNGEQIRGGIVEE